MPNEENLRVAQNILKYAVGSIDKKIAYRPTDSNDPFGGFNYGLMAFSDSDWATSVDTRRSHGATSSCLLESASRTGARRINQ